MLDFVNAKINLGLNIVRRRPDGYHDLQTIFYPIGRYNGTPQCPYPFCDVLEVVPEQGPLRFDRLGRPYDCPIEKDLIYKAAVAFFGAIGRDPEGYRIVLQKHLPDGAGLGGGSADGAFVLRLLNALHDAELSREELIALAAKLGADCPFFIINEPVRAEGIGEVMTPVSLDLSGMWLAVVKPPVYVSTREAFAGVNPCEKTLPEIENLPIEQWKDVLVNDFEQSIFRLHPELARIKQNLYDNGAIYASMSGSGSAIYGIFANEKTAASAVERISLSDPKCYTTLCLL